METWQVIPGYPDYEVSDLGRVRSLRRGIVMRLYQQKNGYVTVQMGYRAKTELVHRQVLLAFIGIDKSRTWVNHKNGIRHDNRLENLEWSTPSENILHKYHVLKTKHPRTKLIAEDIRIIRNKIQSGENRALLAAEYKISLSAIHAIASRQNWKDI